MQVGPRTIINCAHARVRVHACTGQENNLMPSNLTGTAHLIGPSSGGAQYVTLHIKIARTKSQIMPVLLCKSVLAQHIFEQVLPKHPRETSVINMI